MNLYQKLTAVQVALKAPKSQFNDFGKYKYRKAEDILEAVKPLLKEHDCTIVCSDELLYIGERHYVKATATFFDNASEECISTTAFAREELDKKGMDQSQVTGASSSYARKYALNGLLCIDDTQDSDTTNVGDGNAQKGRKPVERKAAPAPAPEKAAAPAPAPVKKGWTHEQWVAAIATHVKNKAGISAEEAYRAQFNPSEEQWNQLMEEVFRFQLANNLTD